VIATVADDGDWLIQLRERAILKSLRRAMAYAPSAPIVVANACSVPTSFAKGIAMERWRLAAIATIIGVLILTFVFAEILGAPGM